MDVDASNGTSLSFLLYSSHFLIIFLDVPSKTLTVRLLPYSLVPGMTLSSPLFIKAVETIAKQQEQPSKKVAYVSLKSSAASSSKDKKKAPSGEFFLFYYSFSSF